MKGHYFELGYRSAWCHRVVSGIFSYLQNCHQVQDALETLRFLKSATNSQFSKIMTMGDINIKGIIRETSVWVVVKCPGHVGRLKIKRSFCWKVDDMDVTMAKVRCDAVSDRIVHIIRKYEHRWHGEGKSHKICGVKELTESLHLHSFRDSCFLEDNFSWMNVYDSLQTSPQKGVETQPFTMRNN